MSQPASPRQAPRLSARPPRRRRRLAWALCSLLAAGCGGAIEGTTPPPLAPASASQAASASSVASLEGARRAGRAGAVHGAWAPPPRDASRVHALLINGGSEARANHLSHVEHIEEMVDVLLTRGVTPDRITVFAADGQAPGADLLVRGVVDEEDPRAWLIADTDLASALQPRATLITTDWPARLEAPVAAVRPAHKVALRRWFEIEGARLRPGDTLLLYTTDHGVPNEDDPDNGALALWGETLTVDELRALLALLPDGVQVTVVMSQCFSGTFAAALLPPGASPADAAPDGGACGFFSVPRDRPAYGCYPEGRARGPMGHGYVFIDALRSRHTLDAAHTRTLREDVTPDAPLRTSDVWTERWLREQAAARGLSLDAFVDALLSGAAAPGTPTAAPDTPSAAPPDEARTWTLLDHLARDHGLQAPRTMAALTALTDEVAALIDDLDAVSEHWGSLVGVLAADQLNQMLDDDPRWASRVDPRALSQLDDAGLVARRAALLDDLDAWSKVHTPRLRADLERIHARAETTAAARWRMLIRLGVLERMRQRLLEVAALRLLATDASHRDASRALAALQACEAFAPGAAPAPRAPTRVPAPMPTLRQERALLDDARPNRLGVSFAQSPDHDAGAVRIQSVAPGSAAALAGLRPGDVVLGPPGAPFELEAGIKRWVLTSPAHQPLTLEIERGRQRATVQVTLSPR